MGKKSSKSRKKLIIKLSIWLAIIILIVTAVFITINTYRDVMGKESDATQVSFTLPDGADLDTVANVLKKNGVIKYKFAFKLFIDITKKDTSLGYNTGTQITLAKNAKYSTICGEYDTVNKVSTGVLNIDPGPQLVTILFKEGSETQDIIKEFVDNGIGTEQGFKDALLSNDYHYDFLPKIGTENRLEGYLFPDTYEFYTSAGERKVILKLVNTFYNKMSSNEFNTALKKSGMSFNDAVILASIIEKEAGNKEDMPLVSSVFHNRLKKEMKLQSCATFNYTLPKAERHPALTSEQMETDSPYNTYLYTGLPPTPICNPGYDALLAAVQPADTDYLYFCSKGDETGSSAFAKTNSEHEANVKKYKGNW
ncbi:MAG: endolytic transglycosylase MltG [Clostridiales bacterium]|nr:MAG: endolytic transglycosylase MltG [Clostridiales bacterium]